MRYIKKSILYCIGLFLMALGVSFSVKSNLGISPVNSIPYVLSLVTGINQGYLVIIVFSSFIVIQMLLLRKEFKWINIAQICFSSIFGYFVMFTNALVSFDVPEQYVLRFLLLVISLFLVAIGVMLYLKANLLPMPAEGVMIAIQKLTKKEFHTIKMGFDITMVVSAVVISFIFLHKLAGIREGTIIAAVVIGKIIGVLEKAFKPQLESLVAFVNSEGEANSEIV